MKPTEIEKEELFHSTFYYFVRSLELLASPPETTCERMGDFNTAWELKDELTDGKSLIGKGFLDSNQEAGIRALLEALDGIRGAVLHAAKGRGPNLLAMKHPSWSLPRKRAEELLSILGPAIQQNRKYLNL